MGVVEGGSEEDVDIGALHKEGAVEELVGAVAEVEHVVGIGGDAVTEGEGGLEGDDAFGGEVYAFDFCHVRHVGIAGALQEFEGFVKKAGDDLAGGAAADDVLTVLGEKEAQRSAFVVAACGWPHDHIGGGVRTEAEHSDGAVVAEGVGAHLVAAFVEERSGDGGTVTGEIGAREKVGYFFDTPAVYGADADPRMGDAVAHH